MLFIYAKLSALYRMERHTSLGNIQQMIEKISLDIIHMNDNSQRKKELVKGKDETYVMYKKGKIQLCMSEQQNERNIK